MKITVKTYASLREYTDGEGTVSMELDDEACVGDVLRKLGIPRDEVKILMLNGRRVKLGAQMGDGDRLAVFPPIAGG
ncbi:MoaD/ThiS family protein [Candidatus Bathyarchaeota archaeon]|nr:MoaD/ThiS family protein [Candidatus Bathyarchaeota archaeon]